MTVAPEFVEKIMVHDLRRLRDREDLTVVSTPGSALDSVRAEGFRVVTVDAHRKLSPIRDLRTVWALWRLMRRERFDLVHTYAPKAGLLGQLAAWLAGVPRRVHGCRGLLHSPGIPRWKQAIIRVTDRVTSALAHETLFLSAADMEYATGHGLCPPDRARHIGSGVDLARFRRTEATVAQGVAWRRARGFADGDIVVLTIGRFVAEKGFREIAAAAAALRHEMPRLRFAWIAPVLAGEEGVLPDLLAASHGVADIVDRVGYAADPIPALAGADLLVHPSYREGVPRVVMEAAAIGLPVLASDIPGCREVVEHDRTALLFPPRDPRALTATLRAALADRDATAERARAAQREVRSRFDQEALSERVWAAHARLIAR